MPPYLVVTPADINECLALPCSGPSAICGNTPGSFQCTCGSGYQLDRVNRTVCVGESFPSRFVRSATTYTVAACRSCAQIAAGRIVDGSIKTPGVAAYLPRHVHILCGTMHLVHQVAATLQESVWFSARDLHLPVHPSGTASCCWLCVRADIDECQALKTPLCKGPTSACINTPGRFYCSCGQGYVLDNATKTTCSGESECYCQCQCQQSQLSRLNNNKKVLFNCMQG